jgi:methanethiol S-methyltransferase
LRILQNECIQPIRAAADQRREKPGGIATIVYAGTAYVLFLATILWLVGFLADAPIFKTVDSGHQAGVLGTAIDVGLIALFGIQHSVMARSTFKARLVTLLPPSWERSTYVLASSLVLAVWLGAWEPLPQTVWRVEGDAAIVIIAVFLAGVAIAVSATFMISHFDFTGLRQAWFSSRGRSYTPVPFQERWLYKYIRHPIALGFLIAFWATAHMTVGHLLFAFGASAYLAIGTILEERDLRLALGATYDRYRARVPAILPLRPRRGPGMSSAAIPPASGERP